MNTATTATTAPRIIRVDIIDRKADDVLPAGIDVMPVWDAPGGLDRPVSGGYGVKDRKMADRLAAAMMAGVVYENPTVKTDVGGKTYVCSDARVLGRIMNADLRRLGF